MLKRSKFSLRTAALVLAGLAVALLSACGMARTKADQLDDNLRAYAGAIRWGAMSEAMAYMDPKVLTEQPISKFDLDRFAQFRVVVSLLCVLLVLLIWRRAQRSMALRRTNTATPAGTTL